MIPREELERTDRLLINAAEAAIVGAGFSDYQITARTPRRLLSTPDLWLIEVEIEVSWWRVPWFNAGRLMARIENLVRSLEGAPEEVVVTVEPVLKLKRHGPRTNKPEG